MATAPFRMEFERKFRIKGGQPVAYDVVNLYQPGMSTRSKTPLLISEVMKVRQDGDPDNPAYMAARMRKELIQPAYDAWCKGEELPASGTPLGAWPGITPEQAKAMKEAGVRTVEEIATANDALINKIPLPGMRGLKDLAINFLAGADQAKVAADLAAKEAQIAEMRAEMEEMKQLMLESLRENEPDLNPDGSEAPRRRGRPPKVHASDEAAA